MEDLVIWGAGAIGGTIGAALARAGANPLLVDADAGACRGAERDRAEDHRTDRGLRDAGARRAARATCAGRCGA